jgi:hypothetical protein
LSLVYGQLLSRPAHRFKKRELVTEIHEMGYQFQVHTNIIMSGIIDCRNVGAKRHTLVLRIDQSQ